MVVLALFSNFDVCFFCILCEVTFSSSLIFLIRIDCGDIVAISDAMTLPAKHSREAFLRMIEEEIGKDKVDDAMLKIHAKKINFNLRIAEIVRQTSCNANLVVMTLPVPKKELTDRRFGTYTFLEVRIGV